jgi:hypothetical protein
MITTTTNTEIVLTQEKVNAFGSIVTDQLPEGTSVTWWMTAPSEVGKGVNMCWDIELLGWIGDYTEKETAPKLVVKEVQRKYRIKLFNADGSDKYPFVRSEKGYIQGMVEDQSRLLVQFFYVNGIFPEGSLDIVGV